MIIAAAPRGVLHPSTAAACLREGITCALAAGAVESRDSWHPSIAVEAIGVTALDDSDLPEISIQVAASVDPAAAHRFVDKIAVTGTAPGYRPSGTDAVNNDQQYSRVATRDSWPSIRVYTEHGGLPPTDALSAGGIMLATCIETLDPAVAGWIRSATLHFPSGGRRPVARGLVSLWTNRFVAPWARPQINRIQATGATSEVDTVLELRREHHKFGR